MGLNVTTKKPTLYEILEVSKAAPLSEIKAAHRRLSLVLMSGASGLSREDVNFRLNVLDVALHTLSTPMLRDEYDGQIAPPISHGHAVVHSNAGIVSYGDTVQANRVAAALEESYKLATSVGISPLFPVKEVSTTAEMSLRSLKKIFRIIVLLSVLASVLQVGRCTLSARQGVPPPSEEEVKATELLAIQEHYQKYGVRAANRAELKLLKAEQRRIEREQREAEFAESSKRRQEQQFIAESARHGASIHYDLAQAEQQAAYEEETRQRFLEEEKRRREYEAERAAAQADEAERAYIKSKRQELGLYE
jgi:hypothetical protein